MPKHFTLAEAQALIAEVAPAVRDAVARKSEYDAAEAAVRSSTERIMTMGGMIVDRAAARHEKSRLEAAALALRESIQKVQEFGCLLKDLDTGLVDFPTLFRGEEAYLCWRLGEEAIAFWHGPDEGFAGRKAIDLDFLEGHAGDSD